jgi:hypothetical protein
MMPSAREAPSLSADTGASTTDALLFLMDFARDSGEAVV